MKKSVLKTLLVLLLFSDLVFALTKTEVSMLYVSIFNRASEGAGNNYWQGTNLSVAEMASSMLMTNDARNYFGNSLDSNRAFVEHIYLNTLNKSPSDDPEGISYWVSLLNSGTSRGQMVANFVNAATDPVNAGNAQNQFINRVEVSNYMADNVSSVPDNYTVITSFSGTLTVTSDDSTVDGAMNYITQYLKDPSENYSPKVDAGEDKNATLNVPIRIMGTATDSDGRIVRYEWREGTNILASTASFTYTPITTGIHTLQFSATDNNGSSVSDEMMITVTGGSSITGKVQDAITSNPISNASIKLYQNGVYLEEVQTDSQGIYTIESLTGVDGYYIEISKSNYLTVKYQNITIEENTVKHLETIMHIEEAYAGEGDIKGQITNSVNGEGVSGLVINFRNGINVKTGTIVRTETTGDNGLYSVSSLEAGSYTAEITGEGYQVAYMTVVVLGGEIKDNQNGTINPLLETGEIRIVLTWGENPSDLDSHLTGPKEGSNDRFHVYYAQQGSRNSTNLDVDDISSYGPETITIRHQISGIYRYSIHDFSNRSSSSSSNLANSGAKVKIYNGNGLVQEFFVPNEAGTLWKVFEISGSTIRGINTMSYHRDEDTIE